MATPVTSDFSNCFRQETSPFIDGDYFASWRSLWRLLPNHFTPAKVSPTIVFPRPDIETNTWSRNRKAHTGSKYNFPVVIQGGAYPFYFELTTFPTGMTIGSVYGDADYGQVTWASPTAGTHDVTIKVTDQDLTEVTVSYQVVVGTAGHVFLSPTGNDSTGDGTIGSPYLTYAAIHLDTTDDPTFSGYHVHHRAGTFALSGTRDIAGDGTADKVLIMRDDNLPAVYLAYEDEAVTINCVGSKYYVGDQHDTYFGGLDFLNTDNNFNDAHFVFYDQTVQNRNGFYDCTFDNNDRGAAGTDNPSCITTFNPGAMREYFFIVDCSHSNYDAAFCDFYATKYFVVDGLTLNAGNQAVLSQGMFIKSDIQYASIRNITSLVQDFTDGPIDIYCAAAVNPSSHIEVCYNNIKEPIPNAGRRSLYGPAGGNVSANVAFDVWSYRNTIHGKTAGGWWQEHTHTFEQNVVVNDETNHIHISDRSMTVVLGAGDRANLTGDIVDGITDANGDLQSTYRTNYLGIRGHEID